jgi:hypothetical protein
VAWRDGFQGGKASSRHLVKCGGGSIASWGPLQATQREFCKCLRVLVVTLLRMSPRTPAAGYIRLELPVFHIGYFKNTVQILQAICKGCSHVLLNEEERRGFLRCGAGPLGAGLVWIGGARKGAWGFWLGLGLGPAWIGGAQGLLRSSCSSLGPLST